MPVSGSRHRAVGADDAQMAGKFLRHQHLAVRQEGQAQGRCSLSVTVVTLIVGGLVIGRAGLLGKQRMVVGLFRRPGLEGLAFHHPGRGKFAGVARRRRGLRQILRHRHDGQNGNRSNQNPVFHAALSPNFSALYRVAAAGPSRCSATRRPRR